MNNGSEMLYCYDMHQRMSQWKNTYYFTFRVDKINSAIFKIWYNDHFLQFHFFKEINYWIWINYLKEVITNFVNLVWGATKITDTSYFVYMNSFFKSVVLIFTAKLYHFIKKHVLLEYLQLEEYNQISKLFRFLTFFTNYVNYT